MKLAIILIVGVLIAVLAQAVAPLIIIGIFIWGITNIRR